MYDYNKGFMLRTTTGEDIGVGGVCHYGPDVVTVSLK